MITLKGKISVQKIGGIINLSASESSGGPLQSKTAFPSHTEQIVKPDEDYYGLVSVTVVPVPKIPAFTVSVTGESAITVIDTPLLEFGVVSITAEDYEPPKTHALYNGVRLPKLPEVEGYPYAWIRNDTQNGTYDLLLCQTKRYYNSRIYPEDPCKWYKISIASADSATEWSYYEDNSFSYTVNSSKPVLWANHDIPNGSATATDIYFAGSDPVPTE